MKVQQKFFQVMAQLAEEFIHNFYHIEGDTVAKRRKKLFILLHQNVSLKDNVSVLDSISTSLKPRTYLESLFKLDFLIYFHRTHELHQLLKEGNDVLVSKITKQIWFFKECFGEIGAEELVNETLPCMSFSVRMKVLRKLSRYLSSEQFEQIFDAVVTRYGIFIASKFITGCGPIKIRQVLVEYPINLTSTDLRILYEKDPDLIDFYFIHSESSIKTKAYESLIKFIFVKDRNLYNHLKEKYKFQHTFGRRTTKKFVTMKKDDVINNPEEFKCYLNMKAVIRKLGKESVQLFLNTLPKDFQIFQLDKSWLNFFSKKYHYSLHFKIIQTHYNIKYCDYPKFINEHLLKLIPENAERALLAKVKVDEGHDEFVRYLTTKDSIPAIKEMINVTSSILDRGALIKYLIETCHINKDIDGLFSVMKYFCKRHKNDEISVHLRFINNIENLFGFKDFTEEMWNCLNELLTIHMLKFDESDSAVQKIQTLPLVNVNVGTSIFQKFSYMQFLFKRGNSVDVLISEYFDTSSEFPQWNRYDKNFGKYVLLFCINSVAKNDFEDKNVNFNCELICEIDNWNACQKDDQLDFYDFPVLVEAFKYYLKHDKTGCRRIVDIFKSKILTTEENKLRNECLEIYWERFDSFGNLKQLKWFLTYEPNAVVGHFDKFFDLLLDTKLQIHWRLRMWRTIKKFTHLQLDERSIQICLSKINDDDFVEQKSKFVTCLAILMKSGDYADLANSFKPANKQLDLTNEKQVRLYNLQCAIGQCFKYTKSCDTLPSLLKYCAGDYFKYSKNSLYSLLYRTPENALPQYLNYLSKQAISVRKHALYLTCELSTSTALEKMIRLLNKQEEVLSLQKHMFDTTIQYFVKNPTDLFFELVKLNMLFISKNDTESLNSATEHLSKIPQKYKVEYIIYCWEYLEKTVDIWEKLKPLKNRLLSSMNPLMALIPLQFGLKIIDDHYMTTKSLGNFDDFVINFVRYQVEKAVIFEKCFNVLEKCDNRDTVLNVLRNWYNTVMASQENDLSYMEPFANYFEAKVNVIENFSDFIKIHFLRKKLEWSQNQNVEDLVENVFSFFKHLVFTYGINIVQLFAPEMHRNLSFFFPEDKTKLYNFYLNMITKHPHPNVALLLLDMITMPSPKHSSFEPFKNIIDIIENMNDGLLQIILHHRKHKYKMCDSYDIHNVYIKRQF
jgi:hypothetical protein